MKAINDCIDKTENLLECQALCKQTPHCTAFTYVTQSKQDPNVRKDCCLRTGAMGVFNDNDHVISGPVTCPSK